MIEKKARSAVNGINPTTQVLQENILLKGLDEAATASFIDHSKVVHLKVRQKIYEAEQTIEDVYFPLRCVLSVVTQMGDGSQIEIGTIGREGMSAFPLLLGASVTANDTHCQIPGTAIVISANVFGMLKDTLPDFRSSLDRYLQAYVNMLGQLAACNRFHTVLERCARWLLLTFDRADAKEIPLTHEFLAMILGTGRSGVTIAAATLQQAGLISYSHGNIRIHDRTGLMDAACECYTASRKQFGGILREVTNHKNGSFTVATDSRSPSSREALGSYLHQ